MKDDPRHDVPSISRRQALKAGGVLLFATSVAGGIFDALAQEAATPRGVASKGGGSRPTYLPEAGSTDPVAHSIAENLFWNEQMMEHALFFTMLMPGPELATQRAEAEKLRGLFAAQVRQAQAGTLDRGNYAAFNRSTIDQVKRIVDFKHRMREEQVAGRLKSLVWPTFFDHTAAEGEYFAARLEQLSKGDVELDRGRTIAFWQRIMGDHADFVAHLLDPSERTLIGKAMDTSEAFRKPMTRDQALAATGEIIDFKVAAEKGIEAGRIKSIIHPALADHVRREALKAADEIKRAA